MTILDLIPVDGLAGVALGLSGGLGLALAVLGYGPRRASSPDASVAARVVLGRGVPYHDGRTYIPCGVRLPLSMPEDGPGGVPEGISAAFALLCAAMVDPRAPDRHARDALAAIRAGGLPSAEFRDRAVRRAERPFSALADQHGWWETLLLELAIRCREAGSWLAPIHLDPLIPDRPDLRAALRAGRDGLVDGDGVEIVGHWMSERAAGYKLLLPWVLTVGTAACKDLPR